MTDDNAIREVDDEPLHAHQTCWKVLTRADGTKRRCHEPAVNVPACFDMDVSTPAGWPRCEEHLTTTPAP